MKKLSLMLVFVALFATLLALSAFAAYTYGPERLITNADVALKFDDAGNPVLNEDGSQKKMYEIVAGSATTGGWGVYYTSIPENVLDGDYTTKWSCSTGGTIRITFANEWEISDVDGLFYDNGKALAVTAFDKDGNQIAQYYSGWPSMGDGWSWNPSSNEPNFDMGTAFANVQYGENAVKYIELYHGENWNNMSPRTYELYIKGRERIPSVGCEQHQWAEEYDPAPTCTEAGMLYRWCELCGAEDEGLEVSALGHIIGSEYEVTRKPNCQDVGEITFTCTREGCGALISRDLTLDDVTDYGDKASVKTSGAGGNTSQDNTYILFDNNNNSLLQASSGWYIQTEMTLDMPYYISSLTIWTGYGDPGKGTSAFALTVYVMKPGETEWTEATTANVAPTDLNAWARTQHIVEFPEVRAEAIMIKITDMVHGSGFASEAKIRGSVVPNAGGDHIWGEPKVVEPSCDHTGYTETTCTVCGESKTSDPKPAIEHLWDIPATCTKGTTCSVCENSKNDALGHTEEDIPAVDATCTEAGATAGKKCTVCGEFTVEPQPIEALGHTFGEEPEVTKQATCVSKGIAQYCCEVCWAYDVNEYEVEIDPNNHVNAEMNSAYTVSSCPDCGDVSFFGSHMGIDNDYTFYFMGNLVNIYKEGMDEYYAYTKVIDAETGVATLVLSEAFDEETEASRGTTFVGFEASVSVNKDDSLYISFAKDDVTYLFGTDPETIEDNSSALNGTYQYVENDVVIFEFVLEDGKITWTIAGGEENGAEATYTFYGSKFTTVFPLTYESGWMGDYLVYSRTHPLTGEPEEYPLTLKSEGTDEPDEPEVNYGDEIDPITVVTTDTYNFIDNYTYTALKSGKYTFYFPAGLGLLLPDNYMPEFDFYANENGQYYTVALAEGQTFEFVVGATVMDTWTISVYYEYAEVEAPEVSDGDELVIGKTDIDAADAEYIFTATENGVLTITTENAIMGEVTIVYSVNGGEAQEIALPSSVAINLVAGDEVVITITAAGYSAFTAAWEKTIPVKDLIVNESSNEVAQSDVIFVYTAPAAGKLTLTTGAAIMGEVVFTYTINGSEALEFALQSTVELALEAGDVVKVTAIAAGYSSLTATWEADHVHEYTYPCDKNCATCFETTRPEAEHTIVSVEAKAATCTEDGNIAYWYCSDCGSAWTDEALTLTTNLKSVVVPAAGHTEVEIPAVLSTPSVQGYTAGVKCSECEATLVAPKAINVTEMADLRDPTFRVASAALTLQENIAMKYRTIITEGFNAETAYMVFVFNNVEYTVTAHDYEESSGRYVFVFAETFPQYMNDNIAAYLYAETAEGEYSMNKILEYSVKTFCINQLKKNNAALTTVISDVLEYGAKTQLFMGYQTDALVTDLVKAEGYTLTPTAFPADGIPSDVNVQALTGDRTQGYDWKSGSLQMGSSTNIVLNFAANDLEGLVVKAEIEGQEPVYYTADKFVAQGGVNYTLYVNHLRAYEYNEKVTFTFEKNGTQIGSTLTYSINTFLYRNYKNTSKYNETARNLMKVIYTYGVSVANYWS